MSVGLIISSGVVAWLAFLLSVGQIVYLSIRNHLKRIDFFAEIILVGEGKEEHKMVSLYFVNKGCPVTIIGIYFDQTERKKENKVSLPQHLPRRLEHGDVLVIPENDLPMPVNQEKIGDKSVPFYVLTSSGKRFWMQRKQRKAASHQPDVSRPINK